ncbi:MAG TPA: hypothetical protein VGK63_06760 [Candidatus Limnocylindrales bacterium]
MLPIPAAALVIVSRLNRDFYDWLTAEDHLLEWGQFLALAAAAVAFAVAARRATVVSRVLAAVLGLAALASFAIAGEEIAWGQRIVGFVTPGAIADINDQGETTIHNIGVLERVFNVGEMVAGLVGVGLPLARSRGWLPESFREGGRFDVLVPPVALAVCFGLAAAYRIVRVPISAGFTVTRFGELPELTLDLAILGTGIAAAILLGRRPSDADAS